ncbi:hypothetical protein DFP72DRAFT_816024, partial [Ephemerocybe angulata]
MSTTVDVKTGHINLKKQESSINDVSPGVVATNRCNTDAKCLLSGTSVKAIVGYVTDYITKGWLKTHQVFQATYDSFVKNEKVLEKANEVRPGNGARQMIMKVVNSLSSKMEIGGPMAALYLLQNPDHYTSHEFIPFYWKNYLNFVQSQWSALLAIADPGDNEDTDSDIIFLHMTPGNANTSEVKVEDDGGDPDDRVHLTRTNGQYFAKSNTDDYRHRPSQLESVSLYDFAQCALKHPIRASRAPRGDLRWFRFCEEHPQYETHAVALDPSRRNKYVLHFIGPSIPRKDVGDREQYCTAMLTLFRPWRTGIDLKSADSTWEEAFSSYKFSERHNEIMANFNMRYECYDARDDYKAIIKAAGGNDTPGAGDESDDEEDDLYVDNGENDEDDDELCMGIGRDNTNIKTANAFMLRALRFAGWKSVSGSSNAKDSLPRIAIDSSLRSGAWNNILKVEKLRAWRRKLGAMFNASKEGEEIQPREQGGEVRNDAYLVSAAFLSKDFSPVEMKWSVVMDSVVEQFSLNKGQEKAFRIIANHACSIDPMQLLMHLGGMGGTGKSTVIRALCEFFAQRDENYRFVLLGPTGTSAALIGGSTYHTFLGINSDRSGKRGETSAKIEEVRE